MAGDWIPMRLNLHEDPAVIAVAAATGLDEFAVVGRLHKLWAWASENTLNGHACVTLVSRNCHTSVPSMSWLNRFLRCDGFAEALVRAGWLKFENDELVIPKFEVWNSQTAKQRLLASRRKAEERSRKRHAPSVTDSGQKRDHTDTDTDNKKNPPKSPPADPGPKPGQAACGGEKKTTDKKPREPNPWFDAVAEMSGANVDASRGRIGKIAADIHKAGISVEQLKTRLPEVVRLYAPHRTALDLNTIQACWSWILKPPQTNGHANGKYASKAEQQAEYAARVLFNATGGDHARPSEP